MCKRAQPSVYFSFSGYLTRGEVLKPIPPSGFRLRISTCTGLDAILPKVKVICRSDAKQDPEEELALYNTVGEMHPGVHYSPLLPIVPVAGGDSEDEEIEVSSGGDEDMASQDDLGAASADYVDAMSHKTHNKQACS